MGISSITVTALTATPTLRGNKLVATVSATGPAANLPTLMLDNVEFYSSTSNDFTTATKVGEGNPEFLHAGLIEEQTYYYWAKPRAVNGSYGAVFPVSPTAGVACTAIGMAGLAFGLANGKITVTENSPSSNKLTVAIKTRAGNDPSASDPVYCSFRDVSVGGAYVVRALTAATSLVISNGSTLGTRNGVACRLWFSLFDDAGTLRLGAVNLASVLQAYGGIDESLLWSSTAEGGAGGADTGGVFYTSTAVTSKPIRLIGYATWNSGLATAGNWGTAPSVIQLAGVGTKKPGDVITTYINSLGSYFSGITSAIPYDNTLPQNYEGQAYLGRDVVPQSPANIYEVRSILSASRGTAGPIIHTICRADAADCLAVGVMSVNADELNTHEISALPDVFNASSVTFQQRFGGPAGATLAFNGNAAGQLFNGSACNLIIVKELMG
jgi:hypothetical protein